MEAATLMLIGQGVQAGAKIAGGMSQMEAGKYNAAALEREGTESFAAATRAADERRRETELVISRQRALGAASGAGAGPSLLDIIGDTAARGEYQAQSALYTGEAQARKLKDRAKIARWEGRNAFIGSILEGVGGVALGAGKYGAQYGGKPPASIGPWQTTVTYG